jgi:hypothetical protein
VCAALIVRVLYTRVRRLPWPASIAKRCGGRKRARRRDSDLMLGLRAMCSHGFAAHVQGN